MAKNTKPGVGEGVTTAEADKRFKSQEVETITSGISIKQPRMLGIALEIEGTQPLIQNCFHQKTLEAMLKKHMGLNSERERKNPVELVELAKVKNVAGSISLSPTAFKKGMLTASTSVKGLKKTQLRTAFFVNGGSIPITFEEERMRMDIVRTAGIGRQPDIRFRPEFVGWKAKLYISFVDQIPVDTIIDLLQRAGRGGVGEWRPEKDGTFGTYCVSRPIVDRDEIREVLAQCEPALKPLVIPKWALEADFSNFSPKMMEKLATAQAGDRERDDEDQEYEDEAAMDEEEKQRLLSEDEEIVKKKGKSFGKSIPLPTQNGV